MSAVFKRNVFPSIVQKVMKLESKKKCTVLGETGILIVNENYIGGLEL